MNKDENVKPEWWDDRRGRKPTDFIYILPFPETGNEYWLTETACKKKRVLGHQLAVYKLVRVVNI